MQMKKFYLSLAFCFLRLICLTGPAAAQVTDDFSDGDFSQNPAWIGNTDSFTVSTGQLRTTTGNASSVNLYLSTASSQNFTSWEFYFRLAFNPSSQNYAEFWLSTDNLNIEQAQNGYFIRIGGNTGDGIGLFKKVNGTLSEIIPQAGNTLVNGSSNNQGYLKITRTNGNWELFEKITSGNYVSFGTGTDNSLNSSLGLGIWIKSSKTNRSRHYFDDIKAEDNSGPDVTPPNLQSVTALSATSLNVTFSETVEQAFSEQTSLYSISGGPAIQSAVRLAASPNTVRLNLADNLNAGTFTLTVNQSKDLAGNLQTLAQTQSFEYAPPVTIGNRSVVINEIYADESPSFGLAGEFVELHNPGTAAIPLGGWEFSDAATSVTLPNYTLPAGGYVILCKNTDTTAYKAFGKTLGISLPSLNNSGDQLSLKNASGTLIDEVNYALSWYRDGTKDDGGFTLEQINPALKCSGASNWIASNAAIGGTPGTQNSVFSSQPDVAAPALDSLVIESFTRIRLSFNENLDAIPAPLSSYSIPGLTISDVFYATPAGNKITLDLSTPIVSGQVYTLSLSGIKDCEGNAISPALTRNFQYVPVGPIAERVLVINEIYADETPSLGLPEGEFMELYNTSANAVQLKGVVLTVGSTSVTLPEAVFPGNSYLILCDVDKAEAFSAFGPTMGISLPTLSNSGSEVRIADANGSTIDRINYQLSWYGSADKQDGGYSLEQINPSLFCSSQANWTASNAALGGSPGTQNSVFSNAPDTQAPVLVSYQMVGPRSVQLTFSEPVSAIAPTAASFVHPDLFLFNIQNRFPNLENITLVFDQDLQVGTAYTLTIKDIDDCQLNKLAQVTITIGTGKEPGKFDLLITEVQADDTPLNNLPQAEYLELYNASTQLLDLAGVQIKDATGTGRLPASLIKPGEYVVLCGTTSVPKFSGLTGRKVLGIASFPTLNSEGDKLLLLNAKGAFVHRFFFNSSDYSPFSQWTSGWSLEMIDPANPCDERNNWAISASPNGGTPGLENSVKASKPDQTAPKLLRATVPSSSEFQLDWDELADSISLAATEITISGNYSIVERRFKPGDFSSLILQVEPEIRRNEIITLTAGPVQDCAGNASPTSSVQIARPSPADSASWILNEILFDPKTGGSDYVELKNVSGNYLDVAELQIANDADAKTIVTETYPVPPGGLVLLTNSKSLTLRDYPRGNGDRFIEMSLPTFSGDSGTVRLLGPGNKVWQKFFYSDKMHAAILDETKGVSLERITPGLPVNDAASWQSASTESGYGTPGLENSQSRDFDPDDSFSADPKAFTPNGDGNKDFTLFSLSTTKKGLIGNLKIYSADGFLVRNLAESSNLGTQSVWKWDGRTDDGKLARMGLYMAIMETIELGGSVTYKKIPVAIGMDR